MNATLKAQNAYRDEAQPIRTDRDNEYDAFARITSRLKAAADRGPSGFKALAAAIYDNRRLWTVLAGDVVSKSNALPPEIQARILYLSEFTRIHSAKVLSRTASVAPLVEINTAVMKGLRRPNAVNTGRTSARPAQECL
ncbi:flagellar biosynthesis regulator FlhF [Roseovarius atlanticus]|uniref:Flagellar biosynthesis regulator FlhF n=1 Tax=Roseovarius atlanticus TaxID=1641875 RepID=A0A0T5NQW3_9RHOB|nr:flagellar biosynthesis regulator FlaF [Roseovarius atlanticus]KRS11320.1 flagellar biosynthesis regulator FlhF [Roseovarius atlanticus]